MRTACRVAEGAALGAMLEARCPIEEVAAELRFRGGGGGGVGAALGERPQVGPAGGAATIERGGGLRKNFASITREAGSSCCSRGLRRLCRSNWRRWLSSQRVLAGRGEHFARASNDAPSIRMTCLPPREAVMHSSQTDQIAFNRKRRGPPGGQSDRAFLAQARRPRSHGSDRRLSRLSIVMFPLPAKSRTIRKSPGS